MVEISVVYEGNFHCASTHGPSGAILPTDAPKDNMGVGEAFSPTDLTATSLASCMLTTMAIVARKKSLNVELNGAKAVVKKHMTSEVPRRIAKIEVVLDLPVSSSHPDRATLEQAANSCPVSLSLHPDVEQAVVFQWKGE